jgi:hypothetical protein
LAFGGNGRMMTGPDGISLWELDPAAVSHLSLADSLRSGQNDQSWRTILTGGTGG